MPGPCSGKNLISILVTDYIQKRRGQALLFSFEYNLLPNLISDFNHCMDRALIWIRSETLAETVESGPLCITDLFQNKSVAYF